MHRPVSDRRWSPSLHRSPQSPPCLTNADPTAPRIGEILANDPPSVHRHLATHQRRTPGPPPVSAAIRSCQNSNGGSRCADLPSQKSRTLPRLTARRQSHRSASPHHEMESKHLPPAGTPSGPTPQERTALHSHRQVPVAPSSRLEQSKHAPPLSRPSQASSPLLAFRRNGSGARGTIATPDSPPATIKRTKRRSKPPFASPSSP